MPTRPGGRLCPRLRGYDYTTPGIYFITFCTAQRIRRLSTVVGCGIRLSEDGRRAVGAWRTLFRNLPEVRLLAIAVMPDHVHALLRLRRDVSTRRPIPEIVGAMKSAAAAAINRARGTPGSSVWQRSFYDTVVRTPRELESITRYIADNPARLSARMDEMIHGAVDCSSTPAEDGMTKRTPKDYEDLASF